MAFTLPPLPWESTALVPHISQEVRSNFQFHREILIFILSDN